MFNPKYKIRKFDENGSLVAYVTYGFIFRKKERVGLGNTFEEIFNVIRRHHDCHHPHKTLNIHYNPEEY